MEGCLFSHGSERFGMVNSMHVSAGFCQDNFPFSVCQPAVTSDTKEAGIRFNKGAELPTVDNSFVEDHEMALAEENVASDDEEEDNDDVADETGGIDMNKVDSKVDWLVPEIRRKESTMDAFNRLTLQRSWIPFHSGKGRRTAVDDKEADLFESMKGNYKCTTL
jgi:hypothetical protein